MPSPTALRKLVIVRGSPAAAYHHFTAELAAWWPLHMQSVFEDDTLTCAFEARAGGRIYEVSKTGGEALWGLVLLAEPARRVLFSWFPGRTPITAQEVTVQFTSTEGGTRVELVHDQWATLGLRAEQTRKSYDSGWDVVLGRCYAEHANQQLDAARERESTPHEPPGGRPTRVKGRASRSR